MRSQFSTTVSNFLTGKLCLMVGVAGLSMGGLRAESFVTQPVGYFTITCRSGSDTIASAPFRREVVFRGTLDAEPTLAGGLTTLTPTTLSGDFTSVPHYLVFRDGSSAEGRHFPVVTQDGATLGIELGDLESPGLTTGDDFELIPYWTLDTLFPADNATIHESAGLLLHERGTEILFFDTGSAAINLAPSRKFFRIAAGWREATRGFPDAGAVIIPPGTSFVIRHPASAGDTAFVAYQYVDDEVKAYPLLTSTQGSRDNHLASVRPVPTRLRELDLEAPAFLASASTAGQDRGDELHVFDSVEAAVNRRASAVFFRVAGQWVEDDEAETFPNADETLIAPGAGLMIRKAATVDGAVAVWVNTPRY